MNDNHALSQELEGFIDNGGHMKGLGDLTLLRKCVVALRTQSAPAPGEVGELVKRLRSIDHMNVEECFLDSHLFAKAADILERLAAGPKSRRSGSHEAY